MDLTLQQKQAIAKAKARKRKAEAEANGGYGSEWRRGAIAPVMKNENTGELHWAMPQFAVDAMKVIEAPRRAIEGDLQVGSDEFYEIGAMGGAMLAPGASQVAKQVVPAARKAAVRTLGKTFKDDGLEIGEVATRLDDLGPNGMLADVSEGATSLTEGIASNMGKPRTTIKDAINHRQDPSAITNRITDDLTKTVGRSAPAFSIVDDLIAKQQAVAGPLYDKVRAMAVEPTGNIAFVLQTPMGKGAFKKSSVAAANRGQSTENMTVGIVDGAKRALDDIYRSAMRAGNNDKASQAKNLAGQLTKEMDRRVPEYRAAREAFAGPEQVKEALQQGLKVFNNKIHPGELRKTVDEMSFSEREAFLQGTQNAVFDLMGTARNDALTIRNLLGKGFNREKLSLAIGREEAADLIRAIDREFIFKSTSNRVTGGSSTAARQAARDEVSPTKKAPDPGTTIVGLIRQKFSQATQKLSGMKTSQKNEELAKLLTANKIDPLMLQKPNLNPLSLDKPWSRLPANASSRVLAGTSKPENNASLRRRASEMAGWKPNLR